MLQNVIDEKDDDDDADKDINNLYVKGIMMSNINYILVLINLINNI